MAQCFNCRWFREEEKEKDSGYGRCYYRLKTERLPAGVEYIRRIIKNDVDRGCSCWEEKTEGCRDCKWLVARILLGEVGCGYFALNPCPAWIGGDVYFFNLSNHTTAAKNNRINYHFDDIVMCPCFERKDK